MYELLVSVSIMYYSIPNNNRWVFLQGKISISNAYNDNIVASSPTPDFSMLHAENLGVV